MTNVNFNRARFVELIAEAARVRDRVRATYEAAAPAPEQLNGPASFVPANSLVTLLPQAKVASVRSGIEEVGEDIVGLRSLVLYGLKGVAAYAHHADVLGKSREDVAESQGLAGQVIAERL